MVLLLALLLAAGGFACGRKFSGAALRDAGTGKNINKKRINRGTSTISRLEIHSL